LIGKACDGIREGYLARAKSPNIMPRCISLKGAGKLCLAAGVIRIGCILWIQMNGERGKGVGGFGWWRGLKNRLKGRNVSTEETKEVMFGPVSIIIDFP